MLTAKITEAKKEDKCGVLRRRLANTAKTIGILLATAAICEVMHYYHLGNQNMAMLYLLAVLLISASTSYTCGIFAALAATLAYHFQIVEPRFCCSFALELPITLVIMLLVTVTAGIVTARIKESARMAGLRERRTQMLYEINRQLLSAQSRETIAALTGEYVSAYLERPAVLYTRSLSYDTYDKMPENHEKSLQYLYAPAQMQRIQHFFHSGALPEPTPDAPTHDIFYVPVSTNNHITGIIGIDCRKKTITRNDLTFVHMLAGQVALALEMRRLSDEQAQSVVEAEKEKTRVTLLRAVSHDLRTPLTSILGASSAMLEQKNLDTATIERLASDIKTDAQWLIRMVENILVITRLSSDRFTVKKVMEAAEEVVSETVSIVRKRFPAHIFQVKIPEALLWVPMDATLIAQVLINLLENAAKNSASGTQIWVIIHQEGNDAVFDIIDNGFGIPPEMLNSLFEGKTVNDKASGSHTRGTGLGLSICQTIIHAHGGTITGRNRDPKGAEFSFCLPLEDRSVTRERG